MVTLTKRRMHTLAAEYQRELDLTIAILRQMRLPVHLLRPKDSLQTLDSGFRKAIGLEEDYDTALRVSQLWSHEQTIYQIHDQFMCDYIYFHLPDTDEPADVVIGPYLTSEPDPSLYLEIADRLGLSVQQFRQHTDYFASLPVFYDLSAIFAVVTSLGEVLWGSPEAFRIVDVNYEQYLSAPGNHAQEAPIEQNNILQQMQQLEMHYAHESELMDIVSKGLLHKVEMVLPSITQMHFQNRTPDQLRNTKNYCIICNTLLRKAAQSGGVHPLYLDKLSSQYARQIETAHTVGKANALIGEMIRSYCRLVRSHAGRHYAVIVQKTLAYIDANLSGDLSLKKLAEMIHVSPGYLSSLFHRETGCTLADYITTQRMKAALQLLKSTQLQIQSIAQLSGYSDPNYFGKLFKRFYGMTPQQYRKEQFNPPRQKMP